MRKPLGIFFALVFSVSLLCPNLIGETPQEKQDVKTELRKEVIRLKYVRSTDVEPVIHMYLDFQQGERVSSTPDKKILTLRALPENVEKILDVIKGIDLKPPDLLFTVQLVLGSESSEKGDPEIQNDPVIRELRNLLRFKSYSLLDSSLIRVMDEATSEVRIGKEGDFELRLSPKVTKDEKDIFIQTNVRLRYFHLPAPADSKTGRTVTDLIQSSLSIKSGDKTVVGVSKLDGGGEGLILIISGKVID
jgi:hypothetical protein